MMAVDEADTPRAHPNGIPLEAVKALKKLKLPEMPDAHEIRMESALVIIDLCMSQTKNRTLQYFCEANGWSDMLVMDPYGRHGSYAQGDPVRTVLNLVNHVRGQITAQGKGGKQSGTSDDLANRRIHIFITFDDLKKTCEDSVILDLAQAIERLRKASQCICCVHVNEEAMSSDNTPIGSKLFTWLADTGVLAFPPSGITVALKVTWRSKFAFGEASVLKAYALWDLWLIRTSTVAFMLLDPSNIADITELYLKWARTAGDTAWDVELTTDRVVSMEKDVAGAKSAMEKDSKVMIRQVLSSSAPSSTPVTQAYWIAGDEASKLNILCAKCNNKRKALGIPAFSKEKCADCDGTPDLGYTQQTSGQCINCCALYQGLHYLGHSSNADNPDEKTMYGTLQTQQKELVGILLALMDQDMFASSVDGRVVSPDIDFLEWMVTVYSAVRGTRTEKDLSN